MCSISILLIDQYSCIVVILILFGKVIFTNLKKKGYEISLYYIITFFWNEKCFLKWENLNHRNFDAMLPKWTNKDRIDDPITSVNNQSHWNMKEK